MDYSLLLRQLQVILTNNRISLIPLTISILSLLVFIISKTFRKTGLFVLVLAFGLDYTIKSLPFDLYYNIPGLYNAITILYILGFIIFFTKVLKMVIRLSSISHVPKSGKKSKLGEFLNFTGLTPFIIAIILNLMSLDKIIGKTYMGIITSISFLYMLIKTVISTYKYLRTKESIVLAEKMDFDEIRSYLKDDKQKPKSGSKNAGRRVHKSFSDEEVLSPTETIDLKEINTEISKRSKENVAEFIEFKKDNNPGKEGGNLTNTQILRLVTGDFTVDRNTTTIKITNLKSGDEMSYTSRKPILKIHENNEYKIDLEFETINEYDYGRFIDILLAYSKAKEDYKFELRVTPANNKSSQVIFFDPSNIYDIDESDYANVGGKIISMNFPKYKINFITGN